VSNQTFFHKESLIKETEETGIGGESGEEKRGSTETKKKEKEKPRFLFFLV